MDQDANKDKIYGQLEKIATLVKDDSLTIVMYTGKVDLIQNLTP